MSDFVPRDILPDLWEEILQRHWTFLETEESIQKLEERKKLEGCLKEFLCIVPHDRKFFLPETAHVLKKSLREMDDFSAYKAMIGFESISQYANNLFTKPWRKEYRVIKMYSGFYQHEINSNLLDADKLFEAMGYRQLPNKILVLDGPICPDQVTNVSRDAMAAYVECQIMKQIFSGLTSMQLSCSWNDVFSFRETHIGGASQAIKSISYSIQERRFRKEKYNQDSCYASIQPTQSAPTCATCAAHGCNPQIPNPNPVVNNSCGGGNTSGNASGVYRVPPSQVTTAQHHATAPYAALCSAVKAQQLQQQHQQSPYYYMMHNNMQVPMHHYKPQSYGPPQMSHSKSLEHYGDHNTMSSGSVGVPQRHSFDQPTYDTPVPIGPAHNCSDIYQGYTFNTCNHPYNVSGNRYPLPLNISNQLNSQLVPGHYQTVPNQQMIPAGAGGHCSQNKMINQPEHFYGDCSLYPPKMQDACCMQHRHQQQQQQCLHASMNTNNSNSNEKRNGNVQSDYLINFEEKPGDLMSHNNVQNQHYSSHRTSGEDHFYRGSGGNTGRTKMMAASKDLYNKNVDSMDDVDGNYFYNDELRKSNYDKKTSSVGVGTVTTSSSRKPHEKYSKNAQILKEYERNVIEHSGYINNCLSDDNSCSYDEVINDSVMNNIGGRLGGEMEAERENGEISNGFSHPRTHLKSNQINKNQDGVGSFESWDYVFQNLEKHGYTKDLGEREDLLVQGLDLDSLKISGNSEKRRTRNVAETTNNSTSRPNQHQFSNSEIVKSKTLEKTDINKETNSNSSANNIRVSTTNHDENRIKVSASSKYHNHDSKSAQSRVQQKSSIIQSKAYNKNLEKGNNNFIDDRCFINDSNSAGTQTASSHSGRINTAIVTSTTNSKITTSNGTGGLHHQQPSSNVLSSSSSTASTSALRSVKTEPINIKEHQQSTAIKSSTIGKVVEPIIVSPNQWSCKFCTFLNPNTKRICEMCYRTKDFDLDVSNVSTCV